MLRHLHDPQGVQTGWLTELRLSKELMRNQYPKSYVAISSVFKNINLFVCVCVGVHMCHHACVEAEGSFEGLLLSRGFQG